jgi:predicted small secreted protein
MVLEPVVIAGIIRQVNPRGPAERLRAFAFVVLAGRNTVEGAGKDIEQGGEKVQDTARDVQEQM